MFSKAYKYIGIFIIVLVLLGHHSFQVEAMSVNHQDAHEECTSNDCHHEVDFEICEKIENDEIQVSSTFFVFPNISNFVEVELKEGFISFKTFENTSERIPISHQQLARSHLS